VGASGCAITGWGYALPRRVVTNDDLVDRLNTSDEWIVDRCGIKSRRVAAGPFADTGIGHPEGGIGTTATLAIEAARQAMQRAGVDGRDVDLLLLCTTTPDQAVPATSAAVASSLGITGGAMDLNAACAGFTYGLVTSAAFVREGLGCVLLVGAETMSRITDWDERTNAFLFGDGAGAVVIEAVPEHSSMLGWDLGADGSLVDLLWADHGGGLQMKGREVFRRAVLATVESAGRALERAKVEASDVALFVPHQANARIMEAAALRLGIGADRVASVVEWSGNTSAATIPIALCDVLDQGGLRRGDIVLFAGFGAGMTWGSVVWRWR
jgi:3-oxoacyl-[acyl-carrier-protein] synthase III